MAVIPLSQFLKGKTSSTSSNPSGANPNRKVIPLSQFSSQYNQSQRQSFTGLGNVLNPKTSGSTQAVADSSTPDTLTSLANTGKALVSGTIESGKDIGAAVSAPVLQKAYNNLDKADQDGLTTIIGLRQKAKAQGKDTTHYDNLIKNYQLSDHQTVMDVFPELKKSNEQVLGDFGSMFLEIASAGVGGGEGAETGKLLTTEGSFLSAALPEGVTTVVEKTAPKGAPLLSRLLKGSLTGAGYGAGFGATGAMQQNESIPGIAKSTAVGGMAGAVIGGGLDAALGSRPGEDLATKEGNRALDAITPKTKDLTPTEYEDLLRRGKITPKTASKPSQYILSDAEKSAVQKYSSLLQDKDPVKNSVNIINEISNKDKQVGDFLAKNNSIFNDGELKGYLAQKMKGITDITIDEARLEKGKQNLIDNFVNGLSKNDMVTLWTDRKALDQKIESVFSGSPTLQKDLKRALRNGVQDFIASHTPDGVYKTAMQDMTQLFDIFDTVSAKASKEKGLNALQVWAKANPNKVKLVKGLVGAGIIGELIRKVVTGSF